MSSKYDILLFPLFVCVSASLINTYPLFGTVHSRK